MPQDLRPHTAAGTRNRRRYEEIARGIHRAAFALAGDLYATSEEMNAILSDPLAFYEQIADAFVAETGRHIKNGSAYLADASEIADAKRRHREDVRYCEMRNAADRRAAEASVERETEVARPLADEATIDRALNGEIVFDQNRFGRVGYISPETRRALNKLTEQGKLARCRGYPSSLPNQPLGALWIAPCAQATVGRVVEIVEARAPFWAAREAFVFTLAKAA